MASSGEADSPKLDGIWERYRVLAGFILNSGYPNSWYLMTMWHNTSTKGIA